MNIYISDKINGVLPPRIHIAISYDYKFKIIHWNYVSERKQIYLYTRRIVYIILWIRVRRSKKKIKQIIFIHPFGERKIKYWLEFR